MDTIGVLTSGGDAPGMNAAIRAVVKVASARNVRVLGVERGYDGLIEGRFRQLTRTVSWGLAPIGALQSEGNKGGTMLGSARSSRFMAPEGREQASHRLQSLGVRGLVVIGGNGSVAGAHHLAIESPIPVVAIPASIDNDIGCTSDAIGVDTALNTIVEACDRISDTAQSLKRAFVVEVMGRQSGYLAMSAAVASAADAVLLPEHHTPDDEIIESIANLIHRNLATERAKRL
ncbi:MAG: 6-phosphofructokinase, partial [Acidimicrobiia bacterium]|nr:6-phosphofructokinase [Acidimicrobiia bacterium]